MKSKEALERFMKTLCDYESDTNNKESVYSCWYRIIKEDLDKLEILQKIFNKLHERGIVYKRVQSLRETANPLYEVTIMLTQKEVETLRRVRK